MALVVCPECGRERVSDTAEMCPECGFAIKRYFEDIREQEEESRKAQEALVQQEKERVREEKRKAAMYSPQNQAKIVEDLKLRKGKSLREFCIYMSSMLIFSALTLWAADNSRHGSLGFIILGCGFFSVLSLLGVISSLIEYYGADSDENVARASIEEYDKMLNDRKEKAAKDLVKYMAEQNIKHPICPNCGRRETERISTLNRTVSIGITGLASGKIGKQYECKYCKHKW